MLDLRRLRSIHLTSRPKAQRLLAVCMLMPNYNLPPRVRIEVEGEENLPEEPVIYAMNHTDRYNYWPFQYWLWRHQKRFTATWVKGKYYENALLGAFMAWTNNIPTPSRGYILTKDFTQTMGRTPNDEEYAAMRALCVDPHAPRDAIPVELLEKPRDMLGRAFEPKQESYSACVAGLLAEMNERFIELNEECFDKGLDLLIFPQGTRSRRLSKGHLGLAQVASRFHRTIVPVGCSGSDKAYPGGSPWAKGATIRYRIGEPRTYTATEDLHLPVEIDPFATDLSDAYRARLQGAVDQVMEDINALVDPEYRFGESWDSDGVSGSRRFV